MTVGAAHAPLSRDAVASSTNDVDVSHYYSRETGWPTLTQPEQDKNWVCRITLTRSTFKCSKILMEVHCSVFIHAHTATFTFP